MYIGAFLSSLQENANYVPPSFSHLIKICTNHSGTNFSIKREDIEEMMNIGKKARLKLCNVSRRIVKHEFVEHV